MERQQILILKCSNPEFLNSLILLDLLIIIIKCKSIFYIFLLWFHKSIHCSIRNLYSDVLVGYLFLALNQHLLATGFVYWKWSTEKYVKLAKKWIIFYLHFLVFCNEDYSVPRYNTHRLYILCFHRTVLRLRPTKGKKIDRNYHLNYM